jgi:4-amino-4-deoxy-L-arabinose transferase-like glycosyltransferase
MSDRPLRLWPVTLLLLLIPLWGVGLFGRWYYTPDEPREADIAWNMAQHPGAVPMMAGVPFCEKPPLTYWASGASMALLGKNPVAARLPNLLWALLTVMAIAMVAYSCAGPAAAVVTGLAAGTFVQSYQVAIWLASDAPLVAGVALALLGAYRGLLSTTSRQRLGWYSVMHVGLVLGFLAKNIVAWVFPGLAFLAFITWERRWRELLRWELYAGLLLQAAVMVPWILAVKGQPDGERFLRIFFWDNLVGRFIPVASEGNYKDGHRNSPGKYLYELSWYVAPWTFLVIAAVRRAWSGVRAGDPDHRGWRWAVCIVVPSLALLSVASTARNIYIAPILPGFALALGLWAARHLAEPDRFERVCLWATAVTLGLVGLVCGPAVLALNGYDGSGTPLPTLLAVIVGGLASGALAVKLLWLQRRALGPAMLFTAVLMLNVVMLVAWRGAFPVFDRWQNQAPTMTRVAAIAADHPIVLWQPDETIRSNLDYFVDLRFPVVLTREQLDQALAAEPRTLVLLRQREGDLATVLAAGLTIRDTLDVPHGRTYVLCGRTP